MGRACDHCGEIFEEEGRLVCPYCGADVDLGYTDPPTEDELAGEERSYEETLEEEGLAGRRGKGCLALLLAVVGAILVLGLP